MKYVVYIAIFPHKVEFRRVDENGHSSYKTYKRPRFNTPSNKRLAYLTRQAMLRKSGMGYSIPYSVNGKPFLTAIDRLRKVGR